MPHDAPLPPCLGGGPANHIERMRVGPSMHEVRRVMEIICAQLNAVDLDPDTMARVELVLSEVLNNVVEHAHHDRPDGWIEVAVTMCPAGICLQVSDDGHPMPGGILPDGRLPDIDVDTPELPEGGFGWYMIRTMTDGLRYSRSEAGNCLCICIHEAAKDGGQSGKLANSRPTSC